MEYRTQEQFKEIYASIINGQYTQASEQCVEYQFFHQDLKEKD